MFGVVFGWIRRLIERSRIRRQIRNVERQNEINKNVVEFHESPVEAYVSRDHSENIVISGNNKQIRDRVCCSAAYNAYDSGEGVVILHCGNTELESLLEDAFIGRTGLNILNEYNKYYDPFLEMDENQIAQLVLSSATESCKVQHNGGIYIKGLTEYLIARGHIPCARSYITCPHDSMWDRISEHVRSGDMTSEVAEEINKKLTSGLVERGNVEHYFNVLNSQAGTILADRSVIRTGDAINIRRAVNSNQIIVFNITPSASDLLMNVLLQEIKNCMADGKKFTLVLDSIPADSSEALGKLLRSFSSRCNLVFSAEDVYAETASVDNLFDSLLGKADTVIISQHDSAETSEKFSNYLGKYQKMEITNTYTMGDTYSTYGQVLPGSNNSNVYGIQRVDRPRVEESEITGLAEDDLFIKKARRGEIIKSHCVYGNARGSYSEPRRRASRMSAYRHFSWGVFILLFILFPPSAFIYSFIVCRRMGKIISVIMLLLMVAAIITQIILMATQGG